MYLFIGILFIAIIILLTLCAYLSDLIIKKNKIIDSINADNQYLQQENFKINHKYNNLILERKLKKINCNTFEIKKIVSERTIYDCEKVRAILYVAVEKDKQVIYEE